MNNGVIKWRKIRAVSLTTDHRQNPTIHTDRLGVPVIFSRMIRCDSIDENLITEALLSKLSEIAAPLGKIVMNSVIITASDISFDSNNDYLKLTITYQSDILREYIDKHFSENFSLL